MRIIRCDKCGYEHREGSWLTLDGEINTYRRGTSQGTEFQLCKKCANVLKKIIDHWLDIKGDIT